MNEDRLHIQGLDGLGARPYTSANEFVASSSAAITMLAAESQTATALGSSIAFQTTTAGTTTRASRFSIGEGAFVEVLSGGELQFNNSGNIQYVGFKAGTLSGNTIWTLPTADAAGVIWRGVALSTTP